MHCNLIDHYRAEDNIFIKYISAVLYILMGEEFVL